MNPARLVVAALVSVIVAVMLAAVAISDDPGTWKLVLVAVALGVSGALCAASQPRNAVGWLLLTVGLVFAAMSLAHQLVEAGHARAWASWVVDRSGAVVVPLTFLALVLLPDGRLPSPRWRPVVTVVVAAQVAVVIAWSLVAGVVPDASATAPANPVGVLPASWADGLDAAADWLLQLPFLLVLAVVATRLRRPADRSRLTGVLIGAAVFAALATVGRLLVPSAADALDVLGAAAFAVGLTSTLLQHRVPVHDVPTTPPDLPDLAQLSGREREVLALVVEGLTNPQIAARLSISSVTARNHVSNILGKLGVENRTQAAALVARSRPGR